MSELVIVDRVIVHCVEQSETVSIIFLALV